MANLVQLKRADGRRAVAVVEGDRLALLEGPPTVYEMALTAVGSGVPLAALLGRTAERIAYDAALAPPWTILPPLDHPAEPTRCLVSGTGLTHKASALNRNAMHDQTAHVTDSMRMFQWGLEGGRPVAGQAGVAPEWFYKGNGRILRAHGEPLDWPAFAEDGGEEPEIAGLYVVDASGAPRRIGFAQGNEFSDHAFEKRNYLYLAHSKLRACAVGPELVLEPGFDDVEGRVAIERAGSVLWERAIRTGERNMCHSLANMEHHHFKYPEHRHPGDVHVHFFGADAFSFGDGVKLRDGDVMEVSFAGFGRPLRNPLRVTPATDALVSCAPV
jgi:hypothetical protein